MIDGARNFVDVEWRSHLNVEKLAEKNPKLYETVLRDLERGYRTTEDELTMRVEELLLEFCRTRWTMSYIGKAKMEIHLPSCLKDKAADIRHELEALIELMENKVELSGHSRFWINAPTSTKRLIDKHRRSRRVPTMSHEFQQLRPLIVGYLAKGREERENAIVTWKEKPTIPLYLYWSY